MMTQQPEALAQECADYATSLRSAINVVKLEGRTPPISFLRAAELFERAAARIAELEALRTGYDASRLEIASLQERVQQLGKLARDVNSRRVVELESQLEAIGAGGVEPLRKRCLHQISEPAQAQPVAAQSKFIEVDDEWAQCSVEHAQMVLANPSEWAGYEVRYLYAAPQPAAPAQPVAPAFDVSTTAGGRGYVAWLFSSVLRRYDFHDYINNVLAADFACALAKWLSTAPQPAAQAAAPAQAGEPWYGHKFKESQSGIWRCECGKTVNELPSTTRGEWFDLSSDELRKRDSENDAMRADYDADRAARGAAQAAPHVGESRFESWYAQECDKGWGTQKQLARDAYAAGMGDSAAQAAPVDAENEIDLLAEAALCERLDACLAAARAAQGGA